MAEYYPLRSGTVAPIQFADGDTLPASLIPSINASTQFTITLAGTTVGQPIQQSGSTFAIATNTVLDAEIIGVATAVSGDEVTISWGLIVNWTHGLSLTTDRFWLGNGTFEATEPSLPTNGRKVILGKAVSSSTFLFYPRQIQQAA